MRKVYAQLYGLGNKIFRVIPGEPDVLERVETLPFPTAMTTIALTTNNRIELRELVKEN